MENEYIPKTAMSIFAHPDDQEFYVAGTLARWIQAGCHVTTLLLTSGDGFSYKDQYEPEELSKVRQAEQLAANAVLCVHKIVFLGHHDSTLENTLDLRKEVTREIRRFKPEVVVTFDPTTRFLGKFEMNHPDHRVTGDVTCDAVFPSAMNRLIFKDLLDEGFEPHFVNRVYLTHSEKPDTWVDISDTLEIKIKALFKHKTQLGDRDPTKDIRETAQVIGAQGNMPVAESFRVINL